MDPLLLDKSTANVEHSFFVAALARDTDAVSAAEVISVAV
jgi:hypothetical protein